jgi:hypothetical protein
MFSAKKTVDATTALEELSGDTTYIRVSLQPRNPQPVNSQLTLYSAMSNRFLIFLFFFLCFNTIDSI